MKKLTALLLGIVCGLGLAACSPEEAEAPGLDPDWFDVQSVVEAGAFSEELEELDADTAFMLYKLADHGLNREDLVEAHVLRSAGATCEEVALLEFADVEKADQAKEAMADYVGSQIEANTDYRPNEIPKLEAALLEQFENTVRLVVANDLDVLKD